MVGRNLLAISIVALFTISLNGCSSDPTPPTDLLLGSADFPEMNITETVREIRANNEKGHAVQVELRGNELLILDSRVLFENRDVALDILTRIKRDQTAQGVDSVPVKGFDDNSGVMVEHLDDVKKSTVFFVEGRTLVRITVSGEKSAASIWEIANRARKKSEG